MKTHLSEVQCNSRWCEARGAPIDDQLIWLGFGPSKQLGHCHVCLTYVCPACAAREWISLVSSTGKVIVAHLLHCPDCGVALGKRGDRSTSVWNSIGDRICEAEIREDVAYSRTSDAQEEFLLQSANVNRALAFKYLIESQSAALPTSLHLLEYATRMAPGEILAWYYRAKVSEARELGIAAAYAFARVESLGRTGIEESLGYWLKLFPDGQHMWATLAAPLLQPVTATPKPREHAFSCTRILVAISSITAIWLVVDPARRSSHKLALGMLFSLWLVLAIQSVLSRRS